jgi:hypothetical protein
MSEKEGAGGRVVKLTSVVILIASDGVAELCLHIREKNKPR